MRTSALLRASILAMMVSLLLTLALRNTELPSGVRVGISFFVYMILQNVLFDRWIDERKSLRNWVGTFVLAAVASGVIALIGTE